VYIDGQHHRLTADALIGQGGEAEVYALDDRRVVKWWKPAEHPDFAGDAAAQSAAAKRLVEAPARLAALPKALPPAVVAPIALARSHTKDIVGYVMPRIAGAPLHALGEPRWCRDHADLDVIAILLALHDAVAGLHRAGVVIGDFNDLNVLVDGERIHLIDVDSYQLPGFPCAMFSERFVDPRLCNAQALVPVRPRDEASDWFAFAAMALRSLLHVGPWGGVVPGMSPSARALRRISVLAREVTYPRAAQPVTSLPDELVERFRAIFERNERGVFPRAVLERLQRCAKATSVPSPTYLGTLSTRTTQTAFTTQPAASVRVADGLLQRRTPIGWERIGTVLAGQTRVWVGPSLGVGFYRAGGYSVGFVFRPDRGPLDDRIQMPRLRGQLVDAHAVLAEDRAWLFVTLADAGRITTTALVVDAQARVLASCILDAPWAAGIAGACATGPHLFVPTDDGIARIEVDAGAVVQTRTFAATAPLVTAADHLSIADGGLVVQRARDAIQLHLKGSP
jgi:tRNA A-37 threonylcarbamoyl transferase component Bud32